MSRQLSIDRVLAELKDRIEHHRSQEAFHAAKEAFHQKEKVRHAEELRTVLERFETFQAAADAVGELVARPRQEKAVDDSIPAGKGAVLSKLVARVVAGKEPDEPFGAAGITREIQERYGARLERRIDVRTVAAKLRRMARARLIHQIRDGRAFHELPPDAGQERGIGPAHDRRERFNRPPGTILADCRFVADQASDPPRKPWGEAHEEPGYGPVDDDNSLVPAVFPGLRWRPQVSRSPPERATQGSSADAPPQLPSG